MLAKSVSYMRARPIDPLTLSRYFSTTNVSRQRLELAYELQRPPSSDKPVAQKTSAVVVCHGLYGSKQNWRSLSKSMAQDFGVPIYALDLRNHGSSPHAESMSYLDMAGDIRKFFSDHKLSNATLIGHSMGGKAAQAMALDPQLPEGLLSHLVSVDMSPAEGPISPEFMRYAECMNDINNMAIKSRTEADKVLEQIEPELSVRQFLLTNLERDGDTMRFRIPVDAILKSLKAIGDFPYAPPSDVPSQPQYQWYGPTLFIKGMRSKYINRHNLPLCKAYFPNMELEVLDTGHWCQAEAPGPFMKSLKAFLLK